MSELRTFAHGTAIVGAIGECRTYRPGRVCVADGCTTVLSIYNPASRCALHEREAAQDERSGRYAWR
jgi:hypothetical protein